MGVAGDSAAFNRSTAQSLGEFGEQLDQRLAALGRVHGLLSSGPLPVMPCLFPGKAETQLARSAPFKAVEMKHRISSKAPQEWRRTVGGGLAVARDYRSDLPMPHSRLLEAVLNEAVSAFPIVDEAGIVALANAAARPGFSTRVPRRRSGSRAPGHA